MKKKLRQFTDGEMNAFNLQNKMHARHKITLNNLNNDNLFQVLKKNCGYVSQKARNYELHIKPWLILTFATAMPICILIVCNSMVLYTLFR